MYNSFFSTAFPSSLDNSTKEALVGIGREIARLKWKLEREANFDAILRGVINQLIPINI